MHRLCFVVLFAATACASSPSSGDSNACVAGTFTGNWVLTGSGASTYKGECGIQGNVTIKDTATAEEIAQFQRVQTVSGTLYLPMAAQALELPALQKVGGTLNLDGSCHLTAFSAPVLATATTIQVAGATQLATFSAPSLGDAGNSILFSGNPALTKLVLGVKALNLNLLILNNPVLTDLDLSHLTLVSSLKICGNTLLASLASLANAVQIPGDWAISGNPALDAAWLSTFRAAHANNESGSCQ